MLEEGARASAFEKKSKILRTTNRLTTNTLTSDSKIERGVLCFFLICVVMTHLPIRRAIFTDTGDSNGRLLLGIYRVVYITRGLCFVILDCETRSCWIFRVDHAMEVV